MNQFLRGFADELVKVAATPAIEPIHADIDLRQALRGARREAKTSTGEPEVQSMFAKIRSQGRPVTRDYLASTLLGAALTPLAVLAGRGIFRAMRNREVRAAMRGMTTRQAKRKSKDLTTGPLFGREVPLKKKRGMGEPLLSYPSLAAAVGTGAMYGSVLQMIRDRFAGSAGAAAHGP